MEPPGRLKDACKAGRVAGFSRASALIEERADLTLELALGPVPSEAFVFVEGAFPRVAEPDEFAEVAPGKLQHFCGWQRDGQF
jgi:hypothetical protein